MNKRDGERERIERDVQYIETTERGNGGKIEEKREVKGNCEKKFSAKSEEYNGNSGRKIEKSRIPGFSKK